MNDELERTWKETVIAYFKVISQHLPGGTEKNKKSIVKIAGLQAKT
jgi:hypothetical protein